MGWAIIDLLLVIGLFVLAIKGYANRGVYIALVPIGIGWMLLVGLAANWPGVTLDNPDARILGTEIAVFGGAVALGAFFGAILFRERVEQRVDSQRNDVKDPSSLSRTKKCPDCAEFVQVEAQKCRFCSYRFETVALPVQGDDHAPMSTAAHTPVVFDAGAAPRPASKESRSHRTIGVAIGVTILSVLTIGWFMNSGRTMKYENNTNSAIGSMRTINTACATYLSEYGKYPDSLSDMGPAASIPSERAADLLFADLASGEKSGYVITYAAEMRGKLAGYVVIARPESYIVDGVRSFYTDESGVIRATPEDRAPSSADGRIN